MKLLMNGLLKFTCGLLLVAFLLFLPAGTLRYSYGWLLIGLLFAPMLIAGFVMFFKSPEFLAKRLDVREKAGNAKRRGGGFRFDVSCRLCGGGLGLSFWLVVDAYACNCDSIGSVFRGIWTVC